MIDLPPLISLRAFEVVYRTGGVRVAARELGITHSSVSRHIGELEAWFGTLLFERSAGRRSLELTAAGQQLGSTVSEAFRDIARTASGVRNSRRKNEVVVSTTQSFATRWLLPRLHLFAEQFPHIEISVRVDQHITDFKNDQADLALRMGRGNWAGLDAIPIMDDYLFPVISPDLKAQCQYLPADQILRRYPLLHDLDPETRWTIWTTEFGPTDLDIKKGPQITSSDLLLRAAILKQGIALARAVIAQEDLANGQLARLSEEKLCLKDAYWLVMPANRKRPDYVSRFMAWIMDEAKVAKQDLEEQFG